MKFVNSAALYHHITHVTNISINSFLKKKRKKYVSWSTHKYIFQYLCDKGSKVQICRELCRTDYEKDGQKNMLLLLQLLYCYTFSQLIKVVTESLIPVKLKIKKYKYQTRKAATTFVPWEKVFLKCLQSSKENTCVKVLFLIKLQVFRYATLLKQRL